MGKHKATEKDVRLALESMGERLIRTIRSDGSGKFDYTVSPSNLNVPEPVFLKLDRDGFFEVYDTGLFPGHPQSFTAKVRA
jgi:hypothetical protein